MSNQKKHTILNRVKARLQGQQADGSKKTVHPIVHIAFGLLLLIGGLLYIVEVNATSTKGFEIRSMERKLNKLEQVQKELELMQADVTTLSALQEKAKDLELVSVERIDTIAPIGNVAVGKK